jgi:hypothetical protein
MWKEFSDKAKAAKEDGSSRSESPPDLTGNVFCFGALLMEIISGKLPEQNDHESICTWVNTMNCAVSISNSKLHF